MTHPIPTAALDDRLGFVGMTGSGKTFGAGTCVERILAKRGRVIIPDLTRDELATRTGYTASSGGFNNLIGSLCALAIFEKPRPGSVALSEWARQVL